MISAYDSVELAGGVRAHSTLATFFRHRRVFKKDAPDLFDGLWISLHRVT